MNPTKSLTGKETWDYLDNIQSFDEKHAANSIQVYGVVDHSGVGIWIKDWFDAGHVEEANLFNGIVVTKDNPILILNLEEEYEVLVRVRLLGFLPFEVTVKPCPTGTMVTPIYVPDTALSAFDTTNISTNV
jgi:hypothetical protein